jgi:hypothetical protein
MDDYCKGRDQKLFIDEAVAALLSDDELLCVNLGPAYRR